MHQWQGGRIPYCPHNGCGYCCCQFNHGNYIVLYPGELEAARAAGLSLAHLDIFDLDYHGGARATCHASDPSCCDGGYKPLDCASYPFFPVVEEDGGLGLLRGAKCPLQTEMIPEHQAWVRQVWAELLADEPVVGEWLRKVALVGYEPVPRADLIAVESIEVCPTDWMPPTAPLALGRGPGPTFQGEVPSNQLTPTFSD